MVLIRWTSIFRTVPYLSTFNKTKTTMRTILLGLSVALFSTSAIAQESSTTVTLSASTTPEPDHYAALRTQVYMDALDLTKEQSASMAEIFLQGEQSVADLRRNCRETQTKIDNSMLDHERKAESILTKEQLIKMMALRKSGDFNSQIPSCVPAKMGDCKHSAACCAETKADTPKDKAGRPQPQVQQQVVPEISAPE